MINLFEPSVGDGELAAIKSVFDSRWLGAGSAVDRFRLEFAGRVGCAQQELTAVTSCTEGLFQAVQALGLGPGDEVVLPTISFIGAAHAVASTGARVVLCDVDAQTLNPTVDHVAAALTKRTRCVIILHYGGHAGDVVQIALLADRHALHLVEDAACSLGAEADGRSCGTHGDIGVWSFDPMKVLTTGDGGMVWARDAEVTERIRLAVNLGGGRAGLAQQQDGFARWWEVRAETVGRRAAMNDIQAAIGLAQLDRVDGFLGRRRSALAVYRDGLAAVEWLKVLGQPQPGSAPIFCWIQLEAGMRDQLASHLLNYGVYSSFRYWPLHRTSLYAQDGDFPGADAAASSTLMLPLHQGLSNADVEHVIDAILAFPSASR